MPNVDEVLLNSEGEHARFAECAGYDQPGRSGLSLACRYLGRYNNTHGRLMLTRQGEGSSSYGEAEQADGEAIARRDAGEALADIRSAG